MTRCATKRSISSAIILAPSSRSRARTRAAVESVGPNDRDRSEGKGRTDSGEGRAGCHFRITAHLRGKGTMLHLLLHRLADPLHLAHDRRGRRQDDALHLAHDRRLDDPLHRHDDRRLRGGHLAAGHGVHRRHCLGTLSRQSGQPEPPIYFPVSASSSPRDQKRNFLRQITLTSISALHIRTIEHTSQTVT